MMCQTQNFIFVFIYLFLLDIIYVYYGPWNAMPYNKCINKMLEIMSDALTKGGKLRTGIAHNIVWANQQTGSVV